VPEIEQGSRWIHHLLLYTTPIGYLSAINPPTGSTSANTSSIVFASHHCKPFEMIRRITAQ
jgi:hypothetical protein